MEDSVQFSTGTAFKFSGQNIQSLEASAYTLVCLVVDTSVSISKNTSEMTEAVKEVVRSCQASPRSDNLMLRLLTFDVKTNEFHGFTELNKCDVSQYDKLFKHLGGSTALYDAATDAVDSLNSYGKNLVDQDYEVNGILILVTDGLDNNSSFTPSEVRSKLTEFVGEQKLESLLSILIGVNIDDSTVASSLDMFKNEAGLDQFVSVKDVNKASIAKLANFISKSISSQSSSLGHGKSKTLAF